ncbi:MAG: metallophosphoesterase [Clostridia bacterium]|nr:metallophosphoesterase [Clostridia bacterium]
MNKKILLNVVALFCLLSVIMSTLAVSLSAAEVKYDTPVHKDMWEEPNFDDPSTYAYSFAFVGDTQCITIGDRLDGTNKLERLYKYIADTAEERKLEHVFVLGDITEIGYWNDYNMVNAAKDWPTVTEEWPIAQKAIFQMNGKVKYNLCRGNHDDYMMNDYFNVPEYTDQFKGEGGFFTEKNATYPKGGRNKAKNPTGAVYWSATTGVQDETITNSWRTMEICGTKYLFITIDYNPSVAVANWVDETLAKFPDHKAIITTHSYINATGDYVYETSSVAYHNEIQPEVLWDRVLSKHANVFMIVCGHSIKANIPFYTVNVGDHGNKVYQFLINPQTYDLKEPRKEGEKPSGTQDQGLVMYMNFSEDGNTISLNYYSTLLNKFLKGANYTIDVTPGIDEAGSIDLAGLSDYGQVTPLVTEKKTATLDGVIKEGEYSEVKLTKQADIGKGKVLSDITEYYAYDDEYIYYAVNARMSTCSINLHLGSSLYFLDELKDGTHDNKITIKFGTSDCTIEANDCYSLIRNNQEVFCKSGTDPVTKNKVCEFKISREYLRQNGSPDNLLSYTLNTGMGTHQFNINADAQSFLKENGVENPYKWTYNYVYFGSRPETQEEPPETTAATESGENGTENGGCGSTLTLSSLLLVASLASAVAIKKKKDNE